MKRPTPSHIKTIILTSVEQNIERGNLTIHSQDLDLPADLFSIEQKILHGGKQEGSKIITLSCPDGLTITLVPTRGMSILHVHGKDISFGWNSPVKEIVNPAYINLESRNGAGWLEGFNEMMVRCGFEWAGHPDVQNGRHYTLHGKAGNTPASEVYIEVSTKAPYEIKIKGLIKEQTFKNAELETLTELHYIPNHSSFNIHDTLTNNADYAHDYQIMYHSNFSKPILEKDAQFLAPIKEISPFNDYAIEGLNDWKTYLGATPNFDEMVFNIIPYARPDGQTITALINKDNTKGVSIEFNTQQLPCLTLWKNTDTSNQGYVTGIEPGSCFAYTNRVEKEQGRIRQLSAGDSVSFQITYTALTDKASIDTVKNEIMNIQGKRELSVNAKPIAVE